MSDAILLTNPELNADRVTVTTAATPRGRRGAAATPHANNSTPAIAEVMVTGDPGDVVAHTIALYGDEGQPLHEIDGKGCTPTTVNVTEATVACTDIQFLSSATLSDRHYVIVGDLVGGTIKVKVYVVSSNFALTLVLTHDTGVTVSGRYIHSQAVAAAGAIYIALGYSDTGAADHGTRIELLRFKPASDATGGIAKLKRFFNYTDEGGGLVEPLDGFALAHDGATWVLFWQTGDSIEVFAGPSLRTPRVKHSERRLAEITTMAEIDSAWTVARRPFLTWSPAFGFVGGFVDGTGAAQTRLITSDDGTTWAKFTDSSGSESTPPALGGTVLWSNSKHGAIVAEVQRLWTLRYSSGTAFGTPNGLRAQFFDGTGTLAAGWSDFDADGADANTPKASVGLGVGIWRGTVLAALATSGNELKVYRMNELSVSTTFRRELAIGRPQFVAGLFDNTRTALFATVDGKIREGDLWTIATAYDYPAANVLDELLIRTFRTDDNGTPALLFDAGVDRVFVVDAVALFGLNMPDVKFQMNDTDSWATPTVDQAITAILETQTYSSVKGNRVVVTGTPWYANEHMRRWAKLSTGVFRILENGTNWLLLDGTIGAPSGSVYIFGDSASHVFGSVNVHRYARLFVTPAIQLPDDYYQIARILFGTALALPMNYDEGFSESHAVQSGMVELPAGGRISSLLNDHIRRVWSLELSGGDDAAGGRAANIDPVVAYFARSRGLVSQIAWWPEGSTQPRNVILGRLPAGFTVQHVEASIFRTGGFDLEEEI